MTPRQRAAANRNNIIYWLTRSQDCDSALHFLRSAKKVLTGADCRNASAAVARAMKSVEGACAHAEGNVRRVKHRNSIEEQKS